MPQCDDPSREIVATAKQTPEVRVRPGLKKDLMKQFRQKHQPSWKLAIQWKVPAYAAVLMVTIMTLGLYLLIPAKERIVERRVVSEPVTDTVYVASQPDTVFIERTIEKPVYVTVYKEREEEVVPVLIAERKTRGKSLADQSEIKDILVSGR